MANVEPEQVYKMIRPIKDRIHELHVQISALRELDDFSHPEVVDAYIELNEELRALKDEVYIIRHCAEEWGILDGEEK